VSQKLDVRLPAQVPGSRLPGLRRPPIDRPQRSSKQVRDRAAVRMSSPFLALFAAFFVAPLVYSLVLSLHSGGTGAFVGLLNYRVVLEDGSFWSGVQRMLFFGAVQVTFMVGLAIVLALFLDSPYCLGRKLFALVFFLPYAIPSVIAAIMWGFLFEPDLDRALNIPHDLGLMSGAVNLVGYRLALYGIMLIVTWEFTGYNMLILLTSLTNVSRNAIEAAKIDGASELAIATRIKLPLIRRTIVFVLVLSIIGTLQLFNEPAILNEIADTGSVLTPNQIIYNTAFAFGNDPLAAAQSVILALITIMATVTFYTIIRRRSDPFRTSAKTGT
jgi:multiple sugar transport system permease protein